MFGCGDRLVSVQRNCRRKPLHLKKRGIGEHTEKPSKRCKLKIVTTVVTLTRKALVSPNLVAIRDLTRSGENVRHGCKSYSSLPSYFKSNSINVLIDPSLIYTAVDKVREFRGSRARFW